MVADFLRSVRQHAWNRLVEMNGWDPTRDNLIIYLITAEHSDGAVVAVKSPFELYASNDLILEEQVSRAEVDELSRRAIDWQPL